MRCESLLRLWRDRRADPAGLVKRLRLRAGRGQGMPVGAELQNRPRAWCHLSKGGRRGVIDSPRYQPEGRFHFRRGLALEQSDRPCVAPVADPTWHSSHSTFVASLPRQHRNIGPGCAETELYQAGGRGGLLNGAPFSAGQVQVGRARHTSQPVTFFNGFLCKLHHRKTCKSESRGSTPLPFGNYKIRVMTRASRGLRGWP